MVVGGDLGDFWWGGAENFGGISCDRGVWGDIAGDDASRADGGEFTDGDSAEERDIGTDGGAVFDEGFLAEPIGGGLERACGVSGAGAVIVDEDHAVADENGVFDGHAFAEEGVAGDFAMGADLHAFLDFDESANFGVVADFAAVKIHEGEDLDILAEFDIGSDALVGGEGRDHREAGEVLGRGDFFWWEAG